LSDGSLRALWYFTGNGAYAQKARDILVAWVQDAKHRYYRVSCDGQITF
jgi:hypothetical protein